MLIKELVWDTWNVTHIARHGVLRDEVEEICTSEAITSETYAGRIRVIGSTVVGRVLTVILAPKGDDIYYPVTARPASRKERQIYEAHKGGEKAA